MKLSPHANSLRCAISRSTCVTWTRSLAGKRECPGPDIAAINWLSIFLIHLFVSPATSLLSLRHEPHEKHKFHSNVVDVGVDLSEFYMSVEWDILEVPAVRWARLLAAEFILFDEFLTLEFTLVDIDSDLSSKALSDVCCCHFLTRPCFFSPSRNEKFYTCCDEPYLDISEYQKTPSKSQSNVLISLFIKFIHLCVEDNAIDLPLFWLNIHFNASLSSFQYNDEKKNIILHGWVGKFNWKIGWMSSMTEYSVWDVRACARKIIMYECRVCVYMRREITNEKAKSRSQLEHNKYHGEWMRVDKKAQMSSLFHITISRLETLIPPTSLPQSFSRPRWERT